MLKNELGEIHYWNELAGNKMEKNPALLQTYTGLIGEEYQELLDATLEYDVLDALADLVVVTVGAIHAMGHHADNLLEQVNNANFSKFCETEEEAQESVEAYLNDNRYINVRYESVGDYYILRGDKVDGTADNKILKSIYFTEPNYDNCGRINEKNTRRCGQKNFGAESLRVFFT